VFCSNASRSLLSWESTTTLNFFILGMSMDTKPEVSSSFDSALIVRVTYDPFMYSLTIEFRNGSIYDYIDVPMQEYEQMNKAPSAGKYFHSNIKSKYQSLRRK
jgi:hypothetical protein